jgi:hypothetical protein
MRLPLLGDRKPSVMLAEMLEFCPAGESSTAVFAYLFLQRLPREIRVLLSEDDPADMRAIVDKADRLIAMHVPQGHDTCATVSLEDDCEGDLVAAMGGELRKKKFLIPKRPPQQQQAGAGQSFSPWIRPGRLPPQLHVLLPRQVRRAGKVLPGGLLVARKLGCRGVISAVRPGRPFYITDSVTSLRYLVDTGSAFSIMP